MFNRVICPRDKLYGTRVVVTLVGGLGTIPTEARGSGWFLAGCKCRSNQFQKRHNKAGRRVS